MKLRTKITIVLFIFSVLLAITISLLNERFVMGSYRELQTKHKDVVVKNAAVVADEMIRRHESLLTDWANWDDALDYVNGTNDTFPEAEIVDNVFIDQQINYILIYDEDLKPIFSKGYDYVKKESIAVNPKLIDEAKKHINTSGILEIDGEYIIFSSAQVSNSLENVDGVGLMVFAHKIDDHSATHLSSKSYFDIKIVKHNSNNELISEIENKKNYEIQINRKFLNTDNQLSFEFKVQKDIEMLGIKNAYRLHIYTLVAIILMGLLVNHLILLFIRRLEKISTDLSDIKNLSDTEYRIAVKGTDEVSQLGNSINNMLDKILQMNNKLMESATTDLLTGVYNRRTGLDKLDRSIRHVKKNNDELTICFVDINDLKQVNDDFGHRLGDEYIKKITEVIVRNIRDKDFVCRLGGDEFLIVFKGCSKEDAKKVVGRINRDLEKINNQHAYEFSMSISKGIVSYTKGLEIDDFVEMADKRMYADKTRYRNKKETLEQEN